MSVGASAVAKKKAIRAPLKTTAVKLDVGLVRKAKRIAEDKEMDLSEYISGLIRGAIERDWIKILKKIAEAEGGEG